MLFIILIIYITYNIIRLYIILFDIYYDCIGFYVRQLDS